METITERGGGLILSAPAQLALDVDDTLAHTRKYFAETLQKFLTHLSTHEIEQRIIDHRGAQNVEEWMEQTAIRRIIKRLIYSKAEQDKMAPIAEAQQGVAKISETISVGLYLTARSTRVHAETRTWLLTNQFPEAHLITRPQWIPSAHATKWKARKLHSLYPHISGIVDDSVSLVSCLEELKYPGKVYLYGHDTISSTRISVTVCPTWQDVCEAVVAQMKVC